ncbi:MAG: PIN domain-containing protein [Pseudomonadota bacterium]
MKYLLDTCVLSDFVKGNLNTIKQITTHNPSELAVSVITIMEVEHGILLIPGKKSAAIKRILSDLIQSINIIPFCNETALEAALIRADLHKRGKLIGYYDILIGATALHHNLIIVTANVKEFERIDKLKVQNWRS